MGRGKPNPRRANGWRRTQLRNRLRDEGRPCHLCGRPIDYSLPAGDPMSFEVDELVPVSKGGDPLDYGNVDAAHRLCNQRRACKDLTAPRRARDLPCKTSRRW